MSKKFGEEEEKVIVQWLVRITEEIDALILEINRLKERMRRLETDPVCYV